MLFIAWMGAGCQRKSECRFAIKDSKERKRRCLQAQCNALLGRSAAAFPYKFVVLTIWNTRSYEACCTSCPRCWVWAVYSKTFRARELAEVVVSGDGNAGSDLYVLQ